MWNRNRIPVCWRYPPFSSLLSISDAFSRLTRIYWADRQWKALQSRRKTLRLHILAMFVDGVFLKWLVRVAQLPADQETSPQQAYLRFLCSEAGRWTRHKALPAQEVFPWTASTVRYHIVKDIGIIQSILRQPCRLSCLCQFFTKCHIFLSWFYGIPRFL